jgi:hypothetical protein
MVLVVLNGRLCVIIQTKEREEMQLYRITARRETLYEFDIEAESEEEAIEEMNRKDLSEDVDEYAYEWSKLEITDIEVEEAK